MILLSNINTIFTVIMEAVSEQQWSTGNLISLISLILTVVGIPTIISLCIKDRWDFKKTNSAKAKELETKQHDEKFKKVIEDSLDNRDDKIDKKFEILYNNDKEIKQDLIDTKHGIQAELRHDIRNACRRCLEQGYRTDEDTEEIVKRYENYEKLGSNGVTNQLYTDFLELPIKPLKHYIVNKDGTKKEEEQIK